MTEEHNPYAAPDAPIDTPVDYNVNREFSGPEYLECYKYIFKNPNWMMNVLFATICQLIPLVGPIVLMGYQFEIVLALHATGGQRYPDFDFNRIVEYLKRGVFPFLVAMLISIVVFFPMMFVFYGAIFAMAISAESGGGEPGPVFVIIMFLMMLVMTVVSMLIGVVMKPFILRAGLLQDFGPALNVGFAKQFLKLVWLDVLLGMFVLMLLSMVATFVGLLALCVGVYFAMALVMMAYAHWYYQSYQLFLSRGGEPIPIPPHDLAAAAK